MLILLFIVFVGLFIIGAIFIPDEMDFFKCFVSFCLVCATAITVISFVCNAVGLSKTLYIDEKIEMYQEENANIEKQIDTIVQNYMNYESSTFIELKGNDAITIVSLYPELQSDELVKSQIATYQANNNKLKELKELKIDSKVYKWWLYFGS